MPRDAGVGAADLEAGVVVGEGEGERGGPLDDPRHIPDADHRRFPSRGARCSLNKKSASRDALLGLRPDPAGSGRRGVPGFSVPYSVTSSNVVGPPGLEPGTNRL